MDILVAHEDITCNTSKEGHLLLQKDDTVGPIMPNGDIFTVRGQSDLNNCTMIESSHIFPSMTQPAT